MPTRVRRACNSTMLFLAAVSFSSLMLAGVRAVDAAAPYYEGKSIRIIVGTSPGGGYDTYTRSSRKVFATDGEITTRARVPSSLSTSSASLPSDPAPEMTRSTRGLLNVKSDPAMRLPI